MLIITRKIRKFLKDKKISQNELSRIIDCKHGTFGTYVIGKSPFPEHIIEKMAPVLEVSIDEIKGWIVADKYSKKVIELAIQAKKEKQVEGLILTNRIDELLKSKNLSRTGLSKLIDYSQGWLNEMIIGHEPISPSVMERMCRVLEISEDEVRGWVVADKYSIESLEVALKEL